MQPVQSSLRHFNQVMKQTAAVVYLPELHVIELWVCMDVGVGNADELPSIGTFKLGRVQSLQHCYQRHIVLNTQGSKLMLLLLEMCR